MSVELSSLSPSGFSGFPSFDCSFHLFYFFFLYEAGNLLAGHRNEALGDLGSLEGGGGRFLNPSVGWRNFKLIIKERNKLAK